MPSDLLTTLGLRDDPDVGPRGVPGAVLLLRLLVADRAGDDHVVARLPLRRGRDLVLGGQLQRVDDAQDLVEVAARWSSGRSGSA